MVIRPLDKSDERNDFSSGDEDLDRFFRRFAGQNQFKHHLAITYIAVDEKRTPRIAGFATIAAGHIDTDDLPPELARRWPQYPLPVMRLGRLAVDHRSQGRGIGSELLAFLFERAWRMADHVGCVGLVVDAKPSAVAFYARFGFRPVAAPLEGQAQSRPEPTMMFLPLASIARAGR